MKTNLIEKIRSDNKLSKKEMCSVLGLSLYKYNVLITKEEPLSDKLIEALESKFGNISEYVSEKTIVLNKPWLNYWENEFMLTLTLNNFRNKASAISHMVNVVTNKDVKHGLKDKISFNRDWNDVIERLASAILLGEWFVTPLDKRYFIRLPTGHYLCEYVNLEGKSTLSYSTSVTSYTVQKNSKEELEKLYPDLAKFIVMEESQEVYGKGFKIIENSGRG